MDTRWTAYIGVSRNPLIINNNVKTRDLKLPSGITRTYDSLMDLLLAAVQSGQGEDDSEGHSLSKHIPSCKLEERFIPYSEKYFDLLRDVLRYSKYP